MPRKSKATVAEPRAEVAATDSAPSQALTLAREGAVAPFPRDRFLKFISAVRIQSKDEGLTEFHLLQSQAYLLDEICAGLEEGVTVFVILKNRQAGISTLLLLLDLFWAFEYTGVLGAFAYQAEEARDLFRNYIEVFLASLPSGYKIENVANNSKMLVLENMSLFRHLVAGARGSSNKMGRSGATNYLHATEVAFYGSKADIDSLNQTLSEKFLHRLYIYESTANGYNHFHDMWQIALKSPAQRAIFIPWWRDERNEYGVHHPNYQFYMPQGTDTPLNERERDSIRDVWDRYAFRITAGQIAWYRHTLETKVGGDQAMMDQEQPWLPEDAFQATGANFFSNSVLVKQTKRAVKQNKLWTYRLHVPDKFTDMELHPLPQRSLYEADLRIWEMPAKFGKYVIGAKAATGVGGDETVFSVWRVYADLVEQVAEYASEDISTRRAAWVLGYLCGLYHVEMWHIDLVGAGMSMLKELDDLRGSLRFMVGPDGGAVGNIMARLRDCYYRRPDILSGQVARHWHMTLDLKRLLMDRFKNFVESDAARIRSFGCIEQMQRTVIADTENIEPSGDVHEDKVVAAALAIYAWSQWLMRPLLVQHFTYERAQKIEQQGGEDAMDGLLRRFYAQRKITVRDTAAAS